VAFLFVLTAFVRGDLEGYLRTREWVNWVLTACVQGGMFFVFMRYCKRRNIDAFSASKLDKKIKPVQAIIIVGIAVCSLFAFDIFVSLL
jgi:hypothetical protein